MMRKIGIGEIITFSLLLTMIVCLALISIQYLLGGIALAEFRGVALTLGAVVLVFGYAVVVYRVFMRAIPLHEGEIAMGSREEFAYHVYILFFLMLFYPVMRSGFLPIPFTGLLYRSLGARLGGNTYSAGIIMDPLFVEVGHNSVIGQYALLVPHVIENQRLAHYRIRVGSHVTIGAHAVVLAGVSIGDNAIVATGAVVPKGTIIGAGEIWGGVPARFIRHGTGSSAEQF
jgi:hypothetical protein